MGDLIGSLNPQQTTAIGNVSGGIVSGLANIANSYINEGISKRLYDYQTDYKKLMDKMVAAGITPAAAAQGLSGVSPSMPGVSSGSMPDLSGFGTSVANASKIPSEISKNISESEYNENKTRELIQQMQWNPKRWQAAIDEQRANIQNLGAQSKYYGSLKMYYDEFAETLKQKRPWEIKSLKQGLFLMAEQINELKSRQFLQSSQADEAESRSVLNYSQSRFLNRRSFEQGWRNAQLKSGWNPDMPLWQNLGRIAFKDPKLAETFISNGIQTLDSLENSMKEHYNLSFKGLRNAFVLDHLFKRYNDFVGTNIRGLGAFMPFLGGLGSSGVSPSFHSLMQHGHYWDDDSYFDYHNHR